MTVNGEIRELEHWPCGGEVATPLIGDRHHRATRNSTDRGASLGEGGENDDIGTDHGVHPTRLTVL
jgi:hypothetical protein